MSNLVHAHEGARTQIPGVEARRLVSPESEAELDGLIVSEVTFTDDHTNPGHSHVEQELFFFLDSVTVHLTNPDETLRLHAGDCLHVGSNRFHRVNSAIDAPARAVIIKMSSR